MALRAAGVIRQRSMTVDRSGCRFVAPSWCGAGLLLVAATVRLVSAEGCWSISVRRRAAARAVRAVRRSLIVAGGSSHPRGLATRRGATRRPGFDVS
jgi:hypothetical protein